MNETAVRMRDKGRRKMYWGLVFFTVIWGVPWAIAAVSAPPGSPGRVVFAAAAFLLLWVPTILFSLHQTSGTTCIGPDGLQLRNLFIRVFIPWDEVVEVSDRLRQPPRRCPVLPLLRPAPRGPAWVHGIFGGS